MVTLVIAEKPSVARDIAHVLAANKRQPTAFVNDDYWVTWAIGHLVGLAAPHEIDARWKEWRLASLPMLPKQWPLQALPSTQQHFAAVAALLNHATVTKVICATDAGREGELIFRYIYALAGCHKPTSRLWISSLTPAAIRTGFAKLLPGDAKENLARAAAARSQADWLVGMNLSRAYTLRFGPDLLSVGRVQTPTLAMIAQRELAINDFVPEPYCEVTARFGDINTGYGGVWFDEALARSGQAARAASRLPADRVLAERIRSRCLGKQGEVLSLSGSDKSMAPPQLYDLTELQRHANALYGMTASDTLATAQALYERHKLLSYPRTDCRHLSAAVAGELAPILSVITPLYAAQVAHGTGTSPLGRRFVDDSKVTDHHAIIPTAIAKTGKNLTPDEARIYDLVCRRLLMAWHADFRSRVTAVITGVRNEQALDRFRSTGTVVTELGWKVLDPEPLKPKAQPKTAKTKDNDSEASNELDDGKVALPTGLAVGSSNPVSDAQVVAKQTQPPRRFTDATLLTAMESAGRTLDSRELEEAMRERGLGTPSTRAAIIETLLTRQYIERQGKALRATPRGLELIKVMHEKVKSAALTGAWECELKRLERGESTLAAFMTGIEQLVSEIVAELKGAANSAPTPGLERQLTTTRELPQTAATSQANQTKAARHAMPTPPSGAVADATTGSVARAMARPIAPPALTAPGDLQALLQERFGFATFRAHQEEICRSVAEGHDALVVMPTGSGKSLCYQLPGLARDGTTLVISPLIALMEDQVQKLDALGLRAARIHSGRPREESRAVCHAYLAGNLDFLFIAPERLSVPGFVEFLARRPPALIAVDEAHCISHWGHDFRPDYRLLGERLPALRPAPVLALTATATVRVQDDIQVQLGMGEAKRFIRGFRRNNLAIEVVERPRADRLEAALAVLSDPIRRPAIVYTPSRKMAEDVAAAFGRRFSSTVYHAGLSAELRQRSQEAFLRGGVDVVVATIAFGMGIDKSNVRTVVHLAMPATLEGYYQEIGRAGRDGLPARALLLWSWGDRKIHESFLERDYPEPQVLAALHSKIPAQGIEREALVQKSDMAPEAAASAIDKLLVHGGVAAGANGLVVPTHTSWQQSYATLRQHRYAQLNDILAFAQAHSCRMVQLIRHFGDCNDRHPCGACDVCAPAQCIGISLRNATASERVLGQAMLETLAGDNGLATGALFRRIATLAHDDRREFERILAALVRAQRIRLSDDEFEKNGETIRFRRAHLAQQQMTHLRAEDLLFDDHTLSKKKRSRSVAVGMSIRKRAPGAKRPRKTRTRSRTKR